MTFLCLLLFWIVCEVSKVLASFDRLKDGEWESEVEANKSVRKEAWHYKQ